MHADGRTAINDQEKISKDVDFRLCALDNPDCLNIYFFVYKI